MGVLPLMEQPTSGLNKAEATELPNGVQVINACPHPWIFVDGDTEITIPPSGTSLRANIGSAPTEAPTDAPEGLNFVRLTYEPTEEGQAFVESVPQGVLILGSAMTQGAYGFPVVVPVPTPETESFRPADKRMRIDTFTVVGA